MPRSPLAALLCALALLVVAPAATAAGIQLKVTKGFAVDMTAAPSPEDEYDVNPGDDPSVFCGSGAPLAIGWTGAKAPVAGTNVYFSVQNYANLDPRRPAAAGKLRAVAVCAKGKGLKHSVKIATSGTSVSCGAKLTLGLAATESWPYIEQPVAIGPSGANGWTADAGPRARPAALCVARSAFKKLKTVRAKGTITAGSTSAAVTASCGGDRRVLAWGYDASPLPGNTWASADTTSARSVPFVGDAVPLAGAKRFKVTFRTADNLPASADAPVRVNLRCGVPAAG